MGNVLAVAYSRESIKVGELLRLWQDVSWNFKGPGLTV